MIPPLIEIRLFLICDKYFFIVFVQSSNKRSLTIFVSFEKHQINFLPIEKLPKRLWRNILKLTFELHFRGIPFQAIIIRLFCHFAFLKNHSKLIQDWYLKAYLWKKQRNFF